MHDPDVVAFEIKRPWPRRRTWGRYWYWPALVTVWHRDPGGYDCFDVCKRDSHWKLHIHHWHIQVHTMQHLRRSLLTRCTWCGGRSRKGDPVNVSHQWDGPRGRWWRGEPGLYHSDCSSTESAHRTCLCIEPVLTHETYGQCGACGRFRGYGQTTDRLAPAAYIVARTEPGTRLSPEHLAEVRGMWKALREGAA